MSNVFYIGNYKGNLLSSHHWSKGGDNNDPFNDLGVDRFRYCWPIVGYTPGFGDFPYFRNQEDLLKVCTQLDKDLCKKLGISSSNEFKVASGLDFKVGDWVELTIGRRNFNDEMEKKVGQEVQITAISGSSSCPTISFDGDGGWQWQFGSGHFKRTTSPPEPFRERLPDNFTFSSPKYGDIEGTLEHEYGRGWYWSGIDVMNDKPFAECGFEPITLQKEILDYSSDGSFPYCKTKQDLLTFCKELHERREHFLASKQEFGAAAYSDRYSVGIDPFECEVIADDEEEMNKSALVAPILIKVCKI
jgi:hypothetical protein